MTDEPREPLFKAPWTALVVVAVIIAGYAWQSQVIPRDQWDRLALSAGAFRGGDLSVLVASMFFHAGWVHALGNGLFALAFATPVARRMGTDPQGAAIFFIFYLLCGLLAGLTFLACHWGDQDMAIGASGAIAGFMGATSRLRGPGPGLAPFRSAPVLAMAASWVGVNLVYGLVLVGWTPGAGGVGIAWEEHLGGYFAGLFLIGPALRLLGRP